MKNNISILNSQQISLIAGGNNIAISKINRPDIEANGNAMEVLQCAFEEYSKTRNNCVLTPALLVWNAIELAIVVGTLALTYYKISSASTKQKTV